MMTNGYIETITHDSRGNVRRGVRTACNMKQTRGDNFTPSANGKAPSYSWSVRVRFANAAFDGAELFDDKGASLGVFRKQSAQYIKMFGCYEVILSM